MNRFDSYLSDERGAAAAEFAFALVLFAVPLPSIVDIGIYTYDKIELENASQTAAQAVWSLCNLQGDIPVTNNCTGASAAIAAAAHTTSLGSAVTIGTVTEGFYCLNASGVLTGITKQTGFTFASPDTGSPPTSCPSGAPANDTPADYVQVPATYTYTPVFGKVSAASLLSKTITRTAWMRVA